MGTTLKDLKFFLEIILQCEHEEGGKHTKYFFKVNGRVVAWTFYSRSWKSSTQIDDSIVSKQAKQMKCSSPKLWRRLLAGQASKEEYFQDLRDNGHISQEEYLILCKRGDTTKR
jgi:hypothetical protein